MLRLAHGWRYETALLRYLKANPHLLGQMGFDSIPTQSALYRRWRRFTKEHQDAIEQPPAKPSEWLATTMFLRLHARSKSNRSATATARNSRNAS